MNATAWQDYRRIWTATTSWRDPRQVEWIGRIALFLALAAGMARLAGVLERDRFWHMEVFVLVGWFAIVWMIYFLPASVLMNSAPNARLVPRQRRRLRQMAMAGWLFMTLGATLAFGTWAAFPLLAIYTLGVMLQRAGIRSAAVLVLLATIWPFLSTQLPPALLHAVVGQRGLVLESAALVLAAMWSLARLYPSGGDRHLDARERVVAGLARFDSRGTGAGARPAPSPISRFAYIPALQRDCRRGNPEALLMHALGPAGHWSVWVPGGAIVLLIALVMALLTSSGPSQGFVEAMDIAMSTATVMAVVSTAHFAQQLGRTRGEQALLRLTPLAGNAALLNPRLAAGMIKSALISWGMVTALIVLLAWAAGADAARLLRQFGLGCLGGQLAATWLLGDFARRLPSHAWWRFPVLASQAGANLGLAWCLARLGGSIWAWLVPISVIGAVALLLGSRRRMLVAPPAFPVARMEDKIGEGGQ